MAKKEKKIVFSEIIDNRINGFAIGISFALVSLFLLNNASYFRNHIVTYAVGAVFGVFGVAGIGVELDKNRKFKGIGNISIGLFCMGVWLALFLLGNNSLLLNVLGMMPLVIGAYGFVRGMIELIYSIWLEIANAERSFAKIGKALFVFVTQLCGLALTVLNILKIFGIV